MPDEQSAGDQLVGQKMAELHPYGGGREGADAQCIEEIGDRTEQHGFGIGQDALGNRGAQQHGQIEGSGQPEQDQQRRQHFVFPLPLTAKARRIWRRCNGLASHHFARWSTFHSVPRSRMISAAA